MALRSTVRTGTTTNFSGPTTGQDLITNVPVSTASTNANGALTSTGTAVFSANPIAVTYIEISTNTSGPTVTSAGSVIVEFGPTAGGALGTAPTVGANGTTTYNMASQTTSSQDFFNPWVTGADIYYGLYGAGSTTINYIRSATGAYANSNIYIDGVQQFAGAALVSQIDWVSVPSAPLGLTATVNGTSITLDWNYPLDDGYTTSGTGSQIFGHRILYRSTSNSTIQSTDDIGDVLSYTFNGLTSNDTYEFWVAAINGVCDLHNGTGGQSAGNTYASRTATTGTNAFVSATTTGGIIRVFSGSTPVVGTTYVNQGGAWVLASAVWGKSGGTWKQSS